MPEFDDDATDLDDETEIEKFQRLFPIKPTDAIEQAAEYLGFMTGVQFNLGNGETWTLPNPSLLDDEQEDRYNQELVDQELEAERYDRLPDPTKEDGTPILGLDGKPAKGNVKMPPRIDGKIVENRDVRIAKALMTEPIYAKFKAAGGKASQITLHWQQMGKFMREREAADSKSRGGNSPVVPVPDGTGS